MLSSLKKNLETLITQSVGALLPSSERLPAVTLETPAEKKHGEFSSNIAMRLAGILKKNPVEIANRLKEQIETDLPKSPLKEKIKSIEVKTPGFLNFFLTSSAFYDTLYHVFKEDDCYGQNKNGQGAKVQIEFVSANPTGPLSVAHARQAAVGDALANILKFSGYDVKKEFYINDEGNQINILGQSIECRAREILGEGVAFPENGYQGEYIKDMAREFLDRHKIKNLEGLKKMPAQTVSQFGVDYLLAIIKEELKDFGVHFDNWAHQSKIATIKNIEATLDFLRQKGFVYEQDGAWWFKSTDFNDDKDRVVKKSDGQFTYLAPDIVYHRDKFKRGFQKIINIWGPDHHGYIARIKAAVQALGESEKAVEVLIVQLATIFKDGKPLSMSTRRGQYISLREVMEEVGVDAARFFFLMRHISVHLDFDLELAKKQTPENPVYYIQYAHARICSLLDFSRESKIKPNESDIKLLNEEEEIDLIKKIGVFPDAIESCVRQLDPFPLINYLMELATCFHKFYDKHRVVSENEALSSERLALIHATKIVLANGLKLSGVSTPTKM